MSRVLNTTALINSVRRRAMVPDDDSTFTDADIIDILNEEIDVGLLYTLTSLSEEHLVTFEDIPTEDNKVRYTIPYRAIGNKLRDVAYIDASGATYELSRISLEELSDYRYSRSSSSNNDVFYIENNQVVLVDTRIKSFKSLRMHYYLRPNVLVEINTTGTITNIDRTNGEITLSSFPSNFSDLPSMDFIGARTPNKIHSFDKTPSSVNQNTKIVTFAIADIPDDLIVGDYIAQAEQTPVPNLPTELHPILAQRAAIHILESLGDTEAVSNAQRRLEKMDVAVQGLIDNRVEGAPEKINPRHTPLQSSVSRFYRFRN